MTNSRYKLHPCRRLFVLNLLELISFPPYSFHMLELVLYQLIVLLTGFLEKSWSLAGFSDWNMYLSLVLSQLIVLLTGILEKGWSLIGLEHVFER